MKNTFLLLTGLVMIFTSCLGDKKAVDLSEMDDTSFMNQNFKGNKINYSKGMSACKNITASSIAKLYNVSPDKIRMDDPTTSNRSTTTAMPVCSFYIEDGDNDFQWLRGSMAINKEVGNDEYMGDVAEATGGGVNWEEAWALKKSMSKSSEWIKDIGKAALWNERHKELKIKFDGYTLNVYPLKNPMNKEEVAKNRDYKTVAIKMAQAAGYIN